MYLERERRLKYLVLLVLWVKRSCLSTFMVHFDLVGMRIVLLWPPLVDLWSFILLCPSTLIVCTFGMMTFTLWFLFGPLVYYPKSNFILWFYYIRPLDHFILWFTRPFRTFGTFSKLTYFMLTPKTLIKASVILQCDYPIRRISFTWVWLLLTATPSSSVTVFFFLSMTVLPRSTWLCFHTQRDCASIPASPCLFPRRDCASMLVVTVLLH